MTHVFGDIHGCLTPFEKLLDKISPGKDDTIITLGDYIDRGPDSRGVIDRLLKLRDEVNLVTLAGNHELMMIDARKGPPDSGFWLLNGGIETLESYQVRKLNGVPDHHWEFYQNLDHIHQLDGFLFTHATPEPQTAVADLTKDDLFWNRFDDPLPREDGLFLICGHTPQESQTPTLKNRHLCLDTGAVHGGFLTALNLETGHYLQSNLSGSFRENSLELQ